VNKDGSISDESILRSVHPLLNEEALRLVKICQSGPQGCREARLCEFDIPYLCFFDCSSMRF
jgi:hypothetical protein